MRHAYPPGKAHERVHQLLEPSDEADLKRGNDLLAPARVLAQTALAYYISLLFTGTLGDLTRNGPFTRLMKNGGDIPKSGESRQL